MKKISVHIILSTLAALLIAAHTVTLAFAQNPETTPGNATQNEQKKQNTEQTAPQTPAPTPPTNDNTNTQTNNPPRQQTKETQTTQTQATEPQAAETHTPEQESTAQQPDEAASQQTQEPVIAEQATATVTDLTAPDTAAIRAVNISQEPKVWVIPIEGPIMQNTTYHLRRSLKDAKAAGADAIILDMNTPGGEVGAVIEIMEDLLKFRPIENTYTFINPDAYSGGAFVAAATRHIIMSPSAVIGAARIIAGTGQEIAERVEEKFRSAVKAKLRSACEIQGHRVDIFQAMVGDEPEIRIDGKLINAENAVLTLTAKEAVRKYGDPPTPLLAQAIVNDIDELLKLAGLQNAKIVRSEPTGFEHIAGWIVAIAPILLLMGIIGIYVELRTPGFGLPGIAGIICFALFFFGHHIAGLSGQEASLALGGLFLLGILLLALEFFVIPGTVLAGLAGIICIGIALVLTMADYWPGESVVPPLDAIIQPLLNLGIATVGSIIVGLILARLLPEIPLFREAITGTPIPAPPPPPDLTGRTGITITDLHPAGKIKIGDDILDVISKGEFIPAKTTVRILEMRGNHAVVEKT
jgi:membrane-bound serine protease (ClpP class)